MGLTARRPTCGPKRTVPTCALKANPSVLKTAEFDSPKSLDGSCGDAEIWSNFNWHLKFFGCSRLGVAGTVGCYWIGLFV